MYLCFLYLNCYLLIGVCVCGGGGCGCVCVCVCVCVLIVRVFNIFYSVVFL